MAPQLSVDPKKKRMILIVHGVQVGSDAGLAQDKLIAELVTDRLNGIQVEFGADLYRYENINDNAQERIRQVLGMFGQGLVTRKVVDLGADIVLDVLVNLREGRTAREIREGLKSRILELFEAGHPLYLVAHSLGTVYSFDVVNELMADERYFARESRRSWPVQGLITMGSPLGLKMFRRNKIYNLGPGRKPFYWVNYWDRTDPVVSGSLYGKPMSGYDVVERFTGGEDRGWLIQDRVVDIGRAWLRSHTGYWNHPQLGDDLVYMITH